MNIDIVNNRFHTKLFDKRDAFGFHINRLPFKDSNIPHRMFYSSACAEMLGICRITSDVENAIGSIKVLTSRMLHQGANDRMLKSFFTRCLNRHSITVTKFNISTIDFLNKIFYYIQHFPK